MQLNFRFFIQKKSDDKSHSTTSSTNRIMKFKVACIQYNPVIGQVEANVKKVWKLLHMSRRDEFDLVMLPELAMTGYNFSSPRHVEPYLESIEEGGTSIDLAREISRKYKCFTVMGYPERAKNPLLGVASPKPTIYNSAVLVGPHGEVLQNYRKTFLYETDEVWGCSENPKKGFPAFDLVLDKEYYLKNTPSKTYKSIKTSMGICMDLNPYKFEAPFNDFEFSMSCYEQGVKLMLCPMAWLSPESPSIKEEVTEVKKREVAKELEKNLGTELVVNEVNHSTENTTNMTKENVTTAQEKITNTTKENNDNDATPTEETFRSEESSFSTINYWILRFFPFLSHPYSFQPKNFNSATVITCNRTGVESTVVYTGSSSIFQFHNGPEHTSTDSTNPNVEVIGSLGQGEEGILLREIDIETQ